MLKHKVLLFRVQLKHDKREAIPLKLLFNQRLKRTGDSGNGNYSFAIVLIDQKSNDFITFLTKIKFLGFGLLQDFDDRSTRLFKQASEAYTIQDASYSKVNFRIASTVFRFYFFLSVVCYLNNRLSALTN